MEKMRIICEMLHGISGRRSRYLSDPDSVTRELRDVLKMSFEIKSQRFWYYDLRTNYICYIT